MPEAHFNLGLIFYFQGDINKAIQYFILASNQNCLRAQACLGGIFYEGKYVKRNITKAIYYFSLASKQNSSYALYMLGIIYYEDKYNQQNITKAIKFFLTFLQSKSS